MVPGPFRLWLTFSSAKRPETGVSLPRSGLTALYKSPQAALNTAWSRTGKSTFGVGSFHGGRSTPVRGSQAAQSAPQARSPSAAPGRAQEPVLWLQRSLGRLRRGPHLHPVSTLGQKTKVDPRTDMTVVCSNSHRMIHRRRDEVLSLEG